MTLIVCVEDRWGQAFHCRRLSRDRVLCGRVIELVGAGTLGLSPYSAPLFAGLPHAALPLTEEADFCFLELEDASPWLERADKLVLFRWNRAYPSDLRFPAHTLEKSWKLTGQSDFPGSSHDKITEEWYEKI